MMTSYLVWLPVLEAEGWSPMQEEGVGDGRSEKCAKNIRNAYMLNCIPLHKDQ